MNPHINARDLKSKTLYRGNPLEIKKINLHMSLKGVLFDLDNFFYPSLIALETISGQKPQLHFSKKFMGEFRLKKGTLSGISTNLRGKKINPFMEDLRSFILPSITGFEGFPLTSLDSQGNFSFSLKNLIIFPEIEEEFLNFQSVPKGKTDDIFLPLDISIQTTAKNTSEALLLFSGYQIPFISP